MATLNITYQGIAADYPGEVGDQTTDGDVRRIAVETARSGTIQGFHFPDIADNAFDNFVVDRMVSPGGGSRVFLRPKVPFGISTLTPKLS